MSETPAAVRDVEAAERRHEQAHPRHRLAPWDMTSEAVRDLHRSLMPPKRRPRARSTEVLPESFRLHPEIGTASMLCGPGGMRRAHLGLAPAGQGSLLAQLSERGLAGFVREAVDILPDGTEVRYESRRYRRGRKPKLVRREPPTVEAASLRLCGVRPRSVPYWVSFNFLYGGAAFTLGAYAWMIPRVGDEQHGAPLWSVALWVTWPYLVGSFGLTLGCYLSFVETINANLHEELDALHPSGSVHRPESVHRTPGMHGLSRPASRSVSLDRSRRPSAECCPPPGPMPPFALDADAPKPRVEGRAASPLAAATQDATSPALPHHSASVMRRPTPTTPEWLRPPARVPASGSVSGSASSSAWSGEAADACAAIVEDLAGEAAEAETCSAWLSKLYWWRYQPASLLWWAALIQLLGAVVFEVACVAGTPGVLHTARAEQAWIYWPSIAASFTFVFSNAIYVLEVLPPAAGWNMFARPEELTLGYGVSMANFAGSLLFAAAAVCDLARSYSAPAHRPGQRWTELDFDTPFRAALTLWGVRFGYGSGSLCFAAGGVLGLVEVLND